MIDCFNCPITGVRLQPTPRLLCPIAIAQNKYSKMKQLLRQLHLQKFDGFAEELNKAIALITIPRGHSRRYHSRFVMHARTL